MTRTRRAPPAPGKKARKAAAQAPPRASKLGASQPQAEAARRAGGGGRPRFVIDLAVVRNSALIGATRDEIATILGISRTTLYARMAEDPAIEAAIEDGGNAGKTTLRRAQWRLAVGRSATDNKAAVAGNVTMLIWLGKQILGQKDKVEHGVDDALEDLLTRLANEDNGARTGTE